jgi:Arginyl-tRNA synthetase
MNIFEEYKDKIISIIKKAEKDKLLIISDNLNSVNVDSTPPKIDFDISTNVSMVLAKPNNKSPNDLAVILIDLLKKEDKSIEEIVFAKPGFINIKFNKDYWNNFTNKVISSPHSYGSANKKKEKIFS